ncbi:hypothetical protein EVAR_661_1 [Eumeta japonica]|uniref:Uncharacterized protein n=1 Tax=Eumeta variegata TaxID=151549 RepID=A0A4C1SBD1_EUMVA|nr:hypothetical protein EVAR_661_1 [Eumeta japonica]
MSQYNHRTQIFGDEKLCSRWIPHNLTETQKPDRITWCNAMLTRFKKVATNLVGHIVTDNERRIYRCNPKTKQQSTVCIYRNEPKPTKAAR